MGEGGEGRVVAQGKGSCNGTRPKGGDPRKSSWGQTNVWGLSITFVEKKLLSYTFLRAEAFSGVFLQNGGVGSSKVSIGSSKVNTLYFSKKLGSSKVNIIFVYVDL